MTAPRSLSAKGDGLILRRRDRFPAPVSWTYFTPPFPTDVESAGKAATNEVEKAKQITADLVRISSDMDLIRKGSSEISDSMQQAATASKQFRQRTRYILRIYAIG